MDALAQQTYAGRWAHPLYWGGTERKQELPDFGHLSKQVLVDTHSSNLLLL